MNLNHPIGETRFRFQVFDHRFRIRIFAIRFGFGFGVGVRVYRSFGSPFWWIWFHGVWTSHHQSSVPSARLRRADVSAVPVLSLPDSGSWGRIGMFWLVS